MGIEGTGEKLGDCIGRAENACGGSGASSKSHFMDFCCHVKTKGRNRGVFEYVMSF